MTSYSEAKREFALTVLEANVNTETMLAAEASLDEAVKAYGRRCVRRASNIDWNVARLGDAEVGVENIACTELLESDQ